MNKVNVRSGCWMMVFLGLFATNSLGQNVDKTLNKADKLFSVKNYSEALPIFLQAVDEGANAEDLDYKIGKCYAEAREIDDRILAIPYLERCQKRKAEDLPMNFYFDLGNVYSDNEQLEQALMAYSKALEVVGKDPRRRGEIQLKIKQIKLAQKFLSSLLDVKITQVGSNVNSEFTEYNPVVSADESILAFTAVKPNTGKSRSMDKFIEEIYISYNQSGNWSSPVKVEVPTENNYGTAGISPDGQEMLIFIGGQKSGGLFKIKKEGEEWSRPTPIGSKVNSQHLESTASITPDGKTIYFASNRPGGYGGLDIYKSVKKEDGTWERPVNLGPGINSKQDEDAPFIHPNMSMLFFTSDGHNAIGGNDIFKSTWADGKWTQPVNLGYPINTLANDAYFTLIADGSRGYFSSDRKGGMGGQDIYMMDMPDDFKTIPLTLIKGRILDAESNQPIPTKIYMIDNETNKKLDFVYHPNRETGDYLVILPPDKNYDMIIESEGFLPYTLNIDIPNQTYFYELYQKISLKTIKHFEVVVGQEVEVKNAFYDSQEDQVTDLRKEHEAALIASDSIDVYEMMGDLIEAGDQKAIDYLVSLIMMSNPLDEVNFDESNNGQLQSAKRTYFYDESDESKFEQKQVADQVILSLPTMHVTQLAEEQKSAPKEKSVRYDVTLLDKNLKIYFAVGGSALAEDFYPDLDQIMNLLNEFSELGVEISGYASSEGDEEFNKNLSNQRAISVLNYLNHKGIVRRRIVAKGYGETEVQADDPKENRRVEVRIIDLNSSASL